MEAQMAKLGVGVVLGALVVAIGLATAFTLIYPETEVTGGLISLFGLIGLVVAVLGSVIAKLIPKHRRIAASSVLAVIVVSATLVTWSTYRAPAPGLPEPPTPGQMRGFPPTDQTASLPPPPSASADVPQV